MLYGSSRRVLGFCSALWASLVLATSPTLAAGPILSLSGDSGAELLATAGTPEGGLVVLGHRRLPQLELWTFDPQGAPLGPPVSIEPWASSNIQDWAMASLVPGEVLAVVSGDPSGTSLNRRLLLQRLVDGSPVEPPIRLDQVDGLHSDVQLEATTDGNAVAVWLNRREAAVSVRRVGPDGTPLGDEILLRPDDPEVGPLFPTLSTGPAGSFVVSWIELDFYGDGRLMAQRFSSDASPIGARLQVTPAAGSERTPGLWGTVAVSPSGETTFLWQEHRNPTLFGRSYRPDGTPRGEVRELQEAIFSHTRAVWADTGDDEELLVVTLGACDAKGEGSLCASTYGPGLEPRVKNSPVSQNQRSFRDPPQVVESGDRGFWVVWEKLDQTFFPAANRILGRRITPQCSSATDALCVNAGRFRVTLDWRDPRSGSSGRGLAEPLTSDTGYFWFFDSDNAEVVVKILDGRSVNGHFWVLFGSLTDVEFDLRVRDQDSGEERVYHNPPFEMASRSDVLAFAVDGPTETGPPSSAPEGDARMLLSPFRFEVWVEWHDPRSGDRGTGKAVRLTDDSGYFWFFDKENAELIVKVLDARAIDDHYWVFFGSLTDVGFDLHVRDTLRDEERVYHNPPGTMASRADTRAFLRP